ncbi:hypothetical protein LTS18_007332 [Coniosporium uncinatum]|uniref:Uncharacterized protein n=1 Tax=Coniosporium uncinatum TaxID=93489 RepID=A0ACC3DPD0_9PEZI|nr:hypothetical protein LTS18_007332 [Coniosporium uncinatum]
MPSLTATDHSTDPPFDIVKTYLSLLESDPDLTMPVAAIESLVLALSAHQSSTISETLSLLERLTSDLKAAIPNPISLSAGTDLFQRYLITSLNRPTTSSSSGSGSGPGSSGGADFDTVRSHLLSNGRLFVTRAKAARQQIASFGRHFVRDSTTILTNGGSRVVSALLRSAAEDASPGGLGGSVRFRVIWVLPASASASTSSTSASTQSVTEGSATIKALRAKGVPVATIPESAVAYAMGEVDIVLVGAEGVVENGGVVSRLGTYQMGMLAKMCGKGFYVVAESHKFVRLYPLGQWDLGIEQGVVEFVSGVGGGEEGGDGGKGDGTADLGVGEKQAGESEKSKGEGKKGTRSLRDAVDFTPPNLISGIITESGVLTPSAVSEELIKIWF